MVRPVVSNAAERSKKVRRENIAESVESNKLFTI